MRIAVIGSRGFNNYDLVCDELNPLLNDIELIVSGGAKGADTLGERWANENNIRTLIFKPDWNKWGKRAGFIRNTDIIANSDYVIAFWDGVSPGTLSSIKLSERSGTKIKIVKY